MRGFEPMKVIRRWYLVLLVLMAAPVRAELIVLSYHDVGDPHDYELGGSALTMGTVDLAAQFSWLRAHDYKVVSIDDVLAAGEGRRPLPEKAILLTFDDGYRGMHKRVFPLLKLFNYPAVLAVMGKWLETPLDEPVPYGARSVPRQYFLTWPQIREMVESGLVDIASHSYDLHHELLTNPQGNTRPAAVTHEYDPDTGRYESDEAYRGRIRKDLARSARLIERETGRRPRAMVWPYGAYNQVTIDVARELGMPIAMSLDDGKNEPLQLSNIRRILLGDNANLANFVWSVNYRIKPGPEPVRVAHVDLDYLYDPDPDRQNKNLGLLLDRIKALGVNTVYLQAFADPDGDGNADSLYFPNRHLPMRADLFNRVSWQLKSRVGVEVYAWLPVLAYDLPVEHPLAGARVTAAPPRPAGEEDYRRLSPFNQAAQRLVGDIYEDLARNAHIAGLLFHDDAYLSDYEDASPWALAVYKDWGLGESVDEIRRSPDRFQQWSRRKTERLVAWTHALAERARVYSPDLKTARNLYAAVVMDPQAENWFAQSLEVFLKYYDYTAIMAMPYMEKARDPERWLRRLVEKVAAIPGAMDKTVFELQSVDWRKREPLDSAILARHMRLLLRNGAANFGYYPEDFIRGHPDLDTILPAISLATEPQAP